MNVATYGDLVIAHIPIIKEALCITHSKSAYSITLGDLPRR